MSESLLEEFLEGSAEFAAETDLSGALFDRELTIEELEAIVELVSIGDGDT